MDTWDFLSFYLLAYFW